MTKSFNNKPLDDVTFEMDVNLINVFTKSRSLRNTCDVLPDYSKVLLDILEDCSEDAVDISDFIAKLDKEDFEYYMDIVMVNCADALKASESILSILSSLKSALATIK